MSFVESGYKVPTSIQAKAIPWCFLADVLAAARTGTGKTACFVLPLLEILLKHNGVNSNRARALVLAPTREPVDILYLAKLHRIAIRAGRIAPISLSMSEFVYYFQKNNVL